MFTSSGHTKLPVISTCLCNMFASRAAVAQVQAHHDVVTAVAYLPYANHAVSAARDGTLRFWAVDDAPKLRLEPSSDGSPSWLTHLPPSVS